MARTRPWGVGDEFWARVGPHIPPEPPKPKGGRPRMDDREAFAAIVYVLRTGIRWDALPREMGASSTVHARFQGWERAGLTRALRAAGLAGYGDVAGVEWGWQSADGATTKAPLVPEGATGAAAAGPNPADRGKGGTKRSLLVGGAGVPLAVAAGGANRNDRKLLAATLGGVATPRPDPARAEQHPCLDEGYDYGFVREEARARGHERHTGSRGEERAEPHPDGRARRWVVGRTHSWINRSRRLPVRWEKKAENYPAFLHLARAQLLFAKIDRLRVSV